MNRLSIAGEDFDEFPFTDEEWRRMKELREMRDG